MKILKFLVLAALLASWQKDQIEPPEVEATIYGFAMSFIACNSGYIIQTANGESLTASLPEPYGVSYQKLTHPAQVWIRYQSSKSDCGTIPGLAHVTSIRFK